MYDGADCMVNPNSWKLPPRPKWCDYDWGASVEVTTKAHLTCRGDANNPGSVLAYGRSTQRGNFVCLSERSGMTCVNKKNGHGFKVNRASYQLFRALRIGATRGYAKTSASMAPDAPEASRESQRATKANMSPRTMLWRHSIGCCRSGP